MKQLMYPIILHILKAFRNKGYIKKDALIHKFKNENYMEGESELIQNLNVAKEKNKIIKIVENLDSLLEIEELRKIKAIDDDTLICDLMFKYKPASFKPALSLDPNKSYKLTLEIGVIGEDELNIAVSHKNKKETK